MGRIPKINKARDNQRPLQFVTYKLFISAVSEQQLESDPDGAKGHQEIAGRLPDLGMAASASLGPVDWGRFNFARTLRP
jgi:hypothetical protein